MKAGTRSAVVFGGGVGAVACAAAVARIVCPGGCQTCETCITTAAPMGAGLITLAGVLVGGRGLARRRAEEEKAVSGPDAASGGDGEASAVRRR